MYNTKFILLNGKEIYPGYLSSEEKLAMQKRYKDERSFMRCGCRPEANLFYRFSEDLRIYPEHNNYQHDIFCCRYKDESGNSERRTAYVVSDESGEVVAFTSFNPLVFSQADEIQKEQSNLVPAEEDDDNIEEIAIGRDKDKIQVSEKKEPKLSLVGLIRSINVDSYTEKILSDKEIGTKERFSVYVYHRMKKVRLARTKKNIGELSLEKDGCRFIYLPFMGFQEKKINGSSKCYLQTKASDGKIYNNFIFPELMVKAITKFTKTYGIEPNENTMVAGFQYLKKNRVGANYKVMGRIHLFQTSDLGIYCHSMIEVDTFNHLQKLVERNKAVRYWIPPEDESVGAIVEIAGRKKKILILFRSKKDECIAYDKSMYVPLVVDSDTVITEKYLYELIDDED